MLIVGGNQSAAGYDIDNSLRFDEASSDYLNRTNGTPTNNKILTFSGWFKRGKSGGSDPFYILHNISTVANYGYIRFDTNDKFKITTVISSSTSTDLVTNRLFRDFSAWYHIVVSVDTTQATSSNRVKLYINGVQETSFSTATYPALNATFQLTENLAAGTFRVGGYTTGADYYDGYMSEVILVDGQALDPTSFGEFDSDSGVWKPKAYTGSYGTNGFFLEFQNSAALGTDSSGNGNTFTVNNLTSVDQSTDTPTNNFCTINPLDKDPNVILADANLTTSPPSAQNKGFRSTFAVSQGKWYWEVKWNSGGGTAIIGIADDAYTTSNYLGVTSKSWSYYNLGDYYNSATTNSYGNSFTTGDIIGVALDADNGYLYFSKNGTFQNSGDPTSGATGTGGISVTNPSNGLWFPAGSHQLGTNVSHNFGSPPYTIASSNSDANGYGNFEHAVPSGYYALCTKNLAEYG